MRISTTTNVYGHEILTSLVVVTFWHNVLHLEGWTVRQH